MRLVLSALITIIFWIGVSAQTPVPPGPISGTWTEDGSPYQIMGETSILDGTTLIIEPGVKVEWHNDSCPMWVYGQILAEGTEGDSIIFTALDTEAGWRSIRFNSTPIGNDSSRFTYCLFEHGDVYGNLPDCAGGAIAIRDYSKIRIDRCSFIDNTALDVSVYPNPAGGAISLENCNPIVTNCLFKNNASYVGGAIFCYSEASPLIENCIFTNNTVYGSEWGQGYGAAITCYINSSPNIKHNIFYNNSGNNGGGAIAVVNICSPLIERNLIFNNSADWGGGIEVQESCSPIILNNTIVHNNAANGGGIHFWGPNTVDLMNNILWGNDATEAGDQVYIQDIGDSLNFSYCDTEGGRVAFGGVPFTGKYIECIDKDPLFDVPPTYYLTWENAPIEDSTKSPCIDYGCPTMTDPDGTRCDMGYQYFNQFWIGLFEPLLTEDMDMEIFPNPTSGKLDIRYSISDIRSVNVSVCDISGRQLKLFVTETKVPGEQTLTINVNDLPDGMYFIRLTSGDDQAVRKLLIRR